MVYRMNVAGLERDLPICRVTDDLYIAGFVVFGDQELTVACAKDLLKKAPEYDYIITAEAKGIPLAHEMARQAGDAKYILARKGPKLYMRDIFSVTVNSITTAKEQKLYLDGADAALMKGKKILVVDDVKLAWMMAHPLNVPIAFAAWGKPDFPELQQEMRSICQYSFDSPSDLEAFLFDEVTL